MHRRRFALVELLLVIAIIPILAVILFPVFARLATSSYARGVSAKKGRPYTLGQLRAAREKMAHRPRRIIFNNDGDDVLRLGGSAARELLASEELRKKAGVYPVTPEGLLEVRTTALLGSQVDSIWYYSSWGLKLHNSDGAFAKLYAAANPRDPTVAAFINNTAALIANYGKDSLEIMIEAGHKRGMEVFYSNRMNDIHDSYVGQLGKTHGIKREHPEWCLSTREEGTKYKYPDVRSMWSACNFAVPQIRQLIVEAMRSVCRTYDVDGIELDFLRAAIYFSETMQFKAVKQSNIDLMTDMVRQIRKVTEEEGLRRGRPILLAARVAEDETLSRSFGLDVGRWLREGLVDVLVTGSWLEFTMPMREIIDLAHRYGVPVYPLNYAWWKGTDYRRGSDENLFSDPTVWRGDALNLFAAGADGIYMFNVFDPTLRLWWELGEPNAMLMMDRTYVWDYLPSQRKQSDVYGQLRLTRYRWPVEVTENGCEPMPLYVGEDLAAKPPAGHTRELTLRVHTTGLTSGHTLLLKVNRHDPGPARSSEPLGDSPKDVWLEFRPDAGLFRQGENSITAAVAGPVGGTAYPKIDQVRLDVRCRQ